MGCGSDSEISRQRVCPISNDVRSDEVIPGHPKFSLGSSAGDCQEFRVRAGILGCEGDSPARDCREFRVRAGILGSEGDSPWRLSEFPCRGHNLETEGGPRWHDGNNRRFLTVSTLLDQLLVGCRFGLNRVQFETRSASLAKPPGGRRPETYGSRIGRGLARPTARITYRPKHPPANTCTLSF
jgi:hypothetical protein